MKLKKLTFLFFAGAIVFLFSCKGDETIPSRFIIKGEAYALTFGYYFNEPVTNVGGDTVGTAHHVFLSSADIVFNTTTGLLEGTGNVLEFTILTRVSGFLPTNIYGVVPGGQTPPVVTYARAHIGYDASTGVSQLSYEVADGTIDITRSGSGLRYGFSWNLKHFDINSNQVDITGSFRGSLTGAPF